MEEGADFVDSLNPDSRRVIEQALVEPSIGKLKVGEPIQLERVGYFCIDPNSTKDERLILNRSVAMRDSWAKLTKNK